MQKGLFALLHNCYRKSRQKETGDYEVRERESNKGGVNKPRIIKID
jgi:hypothetical protein